MMHGLFGRVDGPPPGGGHDDEEDGERPSISVLRHDNRRRSPACGHAEKSTNVDHRGDLGLATNRYQRAFSSSVRSTAGSAGRPAARPSGAATRPPRISPIVTFRASNR